jgi:hypothetical protein
MARQTITRPRRPARTVRAVGAPVGNDKVEGDKTMADAEDRFTVAVGPMTITRESDGKVFYVNDGNRWPGLDYGDMTALQNAILYGLANAVTPLGIEKAKKDGKWTEVHEKAIGQLKK